MARQPLRVSVSPKDRKALDGLLRSGMQSVRGVFRALALLHLADGKRAPETARCLRKLTSKTVRMIAHRYEQGGLDRALYDKQRPGAVPLLDASQKQHYSDGLQRSPGRQRTLDDTSDCGGSSQSKTGAPYRPRVYPNPVATPRPQAVAGKNCGSSRNSLRRIAKSSKMYSSGSQGPTRQPTRASRLPTTRFR